MPLVDNVLYGFKVTALNDGGYSVTVKELWLAENAIYFCSELLGPKEGENVVQSMSYPYVAVKTEAIDLPVVFQ